MYFWQEMKLFTYWKRDFRTWKYDAEFYQHVYMDGSTPRNILSAELDDLLLVVLDGMVRSNTILYWQNQ